MKPKRKPLKRKSKTKKTIKKIRRKKTPPAKSTLRKAKPKPRAKLKPKAKPKAAAAKGPKQEIVGVITHYFPKVNAAVIKLKSTLYVGDQIAIRGHTTDLKQIVTSMQIEHDTVESAKKGTEIGLLVSSRVREHDTVYRV